MIVGFAASDALEVVSDNLDWHDEQRAQLEGTDGDETSAFEYAVFD